MAQTNGTNGSAGNGTYKVLGTRPVRHDGLDKVTGHANYGADLSLPGMLHAKFLRSPHAHARILSIDTSKAEAMAGVKAVITGADFPPPPTGIAESGETPADYSDLSRNVMAQDKALYHGHAIAAVAATTLRQAEEAVQAIVVEYDVLAPVLDVRDAMLDEAPVLHESMRTKGLADAPDRPTNIASYSIYELGDIKAGFAEADVVIEREHTVNTVHQGYIEPHAAVVRTSEDGQVTIWASSQGHFMIRELSAQLLHMDISQIKVLPAEIGGGFGGKTTVYLEPVGILLSRKSDRPVKLVMTRDEVFRASGPAPASYIRCKLGATRDGRLTAGYAYMAYEAGAFPGSAVGAGMMGIFAPYDLANLKIEGYDVCVNKPRSTAYRAPGAPNATFSAETILEEIAEKLGIESMDMRLRNAATEGVVNATGVEWPVIGLKETLEAAQSHEHYDAPLGPNQGRGVAAGWWMNAGGLSSATLQINEDGTASVGEGSPDIGGTRAVMAMIVSEELGIPVDKVRPQVADTESVGYTGVTGGSRVAYATGWAVANACRDAIKQMRECAAKIWEVDADQVEWSDGKAVLTGEGKELTLKEIVAEAHATGGMITAASSFNAPGAAAAFGVHIADVEVDAETGRVLVTRYTVCQDAGKALHPSYVEGQMQGGAAQGIGWAINEEYIFNADGVMENAGFLDYRMPVALDLPMIDTVIVEVPNPRHPYGVRGVGEVPIVPPLAAVANAVHAAVGVRMTACPMSPPRVLAELKAKARSPQAAAAG